MSYVDPSGLKPGDKFNTLAEAAADALRYIHALTQMNGVEYAGQILKVGNQFTYNDPNKGTDRSSKPGPICGDTVAVFHSHPNHINGLLPGQVYLPPLFSSDDTNYANTNRIPVYLVAPSGNGAVYDPATGLRSNVRTY